MAVAVAIPTNWNLPEGTTGEPVSCRTSEVIAIDEPVALQRPMRIPVKLDLLEYTRICDACNTADWKSEMVSTRAGRYQGQVTGYRAFLPTPLPPDPPVRWTPELLKALSDADRAVGRLDGLARGLPNPDLFVAMYVRREAVLSSQIEGTQSSLDDILAFEVDAPGMVQPADITETVNYVRAMNTGLRLLNELPLSGRLIRAVHKELLTGVRG